MLYVAYFLEGTVEDVPYTWIDFRSFGTSDTFHWSINVGERLLLTKCQADRVLSAYENTPWGRQVRAVSC